MPARWECALRKLPSDRRATHIYCWSWRLNEDNYLS
jgi:hypothetical protein